MNNSSHLISDSDEAESIAAAASENAEQLQQQQQHQQQSFDEIPLTLIVRDQTGEEMLFRVKKSMHFSKVFEAYAARKGYSVMTLRFMLEGKRLKGTESPKMLLMEDNDCIDVWLEQVGGCF